MPRRPALETLWECGPPMLRPSRGSRPAAQCLGGAVFITACAHAVHVCACNHMCAQWESGNTESPVLLGGSPRLARVALGARCGLPEFLELLTRSCCPATRKGTAQAPCAGLTGSAVAAVRAEAPACGGGAGRPSPSALPGRVPQAQRSPSSLLPAAPAASLPHGGLCPRCPVSAAAGGEEAVSGKQLGVGAR